MDDFTQPPAEENGAAQEGVLKFPCEFPLKIIGDHSLEDDFEAFVLPIVVRHVPYLDQGQVTRRLSSGGKYLAVTVTFIAESRLQLDDLYRELSSHKRVRMLL
ncbi:YbeD family protein [Levilinea saccharolytica]|uniref:Uncharacterized conserved protein n=1 Tax=Levilinea saccharolytica TaxID=229921 RepID=A0A0M8JSD9_9CHLR|nr:DUF493 domain-containing protein [Levilinea saccharolytica]KPL87480.1 hypothetical protein ADN01_04855 [Levilinea saccharolytica]GAP19665.1 uncharacterized conserved protein [Levilinea saccharolytica]